MRGTGTYRPPTFLQAARKVAADQWPMIQQTHKVGPTARWYSCAGHGGLVAEANVTPEVLDVLCSTGWNVATLTAYPAERWGGEYHARRMNVDVDPDHEWNGWPHDDIVVLIGEEDCAWSLVVLVRPDLAEHLAGGAFNIESSEQVLVYARQCAERWYADALDALDALDAAWKPEPEMAVC